MATLREASLNRQGIPRHKAGYFLRDLRGRTMALAGVRFVNGRSTKPVSGWKLRHLIAAMGNVLELEPVEAVKKPKPKPEPVVAKAPTEPSLDDLTKSELEQLAFRRGIDIPAKVTKAELRDLIEHAQD